MKSRRVSFLFQHVHEHGDHDDVGKNCQDGDAGDNRMPEEVAFAAFSTFAGVAGHVSGRIAAIPIVQN